MYVLQLSKENLDLARAEAEALCGKGELEDDLLFVKNIKYASRLAYSKKIYELIGENEIINYRKIKCPFAVRSGSVELAKKIADLIHRNKKNASINLKTPKTLIEIRKISNKTYSLKLIKKINRDISARKPHLRPAHHPSSLNPLLARAMINLTGLKTSKFLDPMCGGGGILIEGSLMGLKPEGWDIEKTMVWRAKTNLKFEKCEAEVKLKDALKLTKTNYIVADLPYGKNTKKQDFIELYKNFFAILGNKLGTKAVIGYPHYIDAKKLIPKTLKIENEFSIYVHKHLTRKILIVSS